MLRFATYESIKKANIAEIYQRFPSLAHTTVIKNNLVWVLTFPHPDGDLQETPVNGEKGVTYKFGPRDAPLPPNDHNKTIAALRPEWDIIDTRVAFCQPMGGDVSWTGSRLAGDIIYDIHADDHRTGPIDGFKELLLRQERSDAMIFGLRRNANFDMSFFSVEEDLEKASKRLGLLLVRWAGSDPAAIIRFIRELGTKALIGRIDKIHLDLEFACYIVAFPVDLINATHVPIAKVHASASNAIRVVHIDLMIVDRLLDTLFKAPASTFFAFWIKRVVGDLFKIAGANTIMKIDIKTKIEQPARGARKVKKDDNANRLEEICQGLIRDAAKDYINQVESVHIAGWKRVVTEVSEA